MDLHGKCVLLGVSGGIILKRGKRGIIETSSDGTPLPDCGNSGDPVTLRTDFREGWDDTDSDRECVCGKKVLYFIEKNI